MMPTGISSYRAPFMGTSHLVTSNNYHASAAGYGILEEGGNAVDAGVATGLAINVTMPQMTNLGGVWRRSSFTWPTAPRCRPSAGWGAGPGVPRSRPTSRRYGRRPWAAKRTIAPESLGQGFHPHLIRLLGRG